MPLRGSQESKVPSSGIISKVKSFNYQAFELFWMVFLFTPTSTRKPSVFLKHILDETEYIILNSQNLRKDSFLEDETLKRAFIRSLEIIGYGVHTSPDQLQNTESSPPSPPSLGGISFQSPPELTSEPGRVSRPKERARKGDLGGEISSKNRTINKK